MSKKSISESTIQTLVSRFKGIPETKITQLVIAYQNKDVKEINRIRTSINQKDLTVLKDSSALGYARNAIQYLSHIIQNPKNSVIKFIKKKYNIQLTKDYETNIELMNKEEDIKRSIDIWQIMSLDYLGTINDVGYCYVATFSSNVILEVIKRLNLTKERIKILRDNLISDYRLIIELEFQGGNLGWISSNRVSIPNINELLNVFNWDKKGKKGRGKDKEGNPIKKKIVQMDYEALIEQIRLDNSAILIDNEYEYSDNQEIVQNINSIQIEWS